MSRAKTSRVDISAKSATPGSGPSKRLRAEGSRSPGIRLAVFAGLGAVIGWLAFQARSAWMGAPRTPVGVNQTAPISVGGEQATPSASCCSDAQQDGAGAGALPAQVVAPPGIVPRTNDLPAPGPVPAGMVWVPGGIYWRGNDTKSHRDSLPWHLVEVDGFWMDAGPVTNAQFERFVKATGYVTVAERTPKAVDFPDAPPRTWRRFRRLFAAARARSARQSSSLVELREGGQLAAPRRPGERLEGVGKTPRRSGRFRGCARLTASGPASVCRPRPSSSSPPEAGWTGTGMPGATSSGRAASGWPTSGRAAFPTRTRRRMGT